MLVSEAERLKKQLEMDIRERIGEFEKATALIITQVYVNRLTVQPTGGDRSSVLNSIECEVQLL